MEIGSARGLKRENDPTGWNFDSLTSNTRCEDPAKRFKPTETVDNMKTESSTSSFSVHVLQNDAQMTDVDKEPITGSEREQVAKESLGKLSKLFSQCLQAIGELDPTVSHKSTISDLVEGFHKKTEKFYSIWIDEDRLRDAEHNANPEDQRMA
ncbi:hypothetical protein PCASD_02795 [Puccinia coronata f. sp. avenae]|uniref:Uncharacterized protein n=1 Tax=Puccinia coronata f. sp. avenae TaxID=200324 RepID=A0A2N5VFW0_9BASI|nr:hypothetical protein PCASD_02795 [Puccinia coronata f. sp. avenae]